MAYGKLALQEIDATTVTDNGEKQVIGKGAMVEVDGLPPWAARSAAAMMA